MDHINVVTLGLLLFVACVVAVTQIAFKPDWARHARAAPFKRNDIMLDAMPIGVLVFPGTGISANLADKARKMGIPIWRFD